MTATGTLVCDKQLIASLHDMLNHDEFERIMSDVKQKADKLQLISPHKSPRVFRPPTWWTK